MRDLMNNIVVSQLFPPKAAVTDNTAQVSNIIDTSLGESCTLVLNMGTLTDADATFAVTMEHGDDSALADTAVPASTDLIGTTTLANFQFDSDNKCRKLGYIGQKRYVRMTVTPTNNTGNLFLSGISIVGHLKNAPSVNPPA